MKRIEYTGQNQKAVFDEGDDCQRVRSESWSRRKFDLSVGLQRAFNNFVKESGKGVGGRL